uniref:LysM peptidoglycan-binding domain-containing protein n=1 Tax=Tissierella praeacuta TaxID=43131 RepID=UPI00333E78CA
VICIPSTPTPPTCPTGTFAYTIRSGDTLFNLANRFNTTVEAILRANPGIDPNNLQVGQVICIPSTPTPPTCPTGTFAYTIRSGDTLFNLANRFNTTVEAILRANPGIDPNNLQVGQVICIPSTPTPPTCPTGTFAYTIRSGDTLFNLANRFNTTVEAILRANPGIDPNNLQVGQVICIPSTPTPPTCPTGTFAYTIRSGDTLFNLANRFNTTVEAILRANPGIDPNNLQVGQVICIPSTPTPPTCPTGTFAYTIRSGDTLFNLANRFNTTVEAILRANPGIDPNNLQVGQVICIPSTPTPPTCPTGTFAYTIRSGDTLFNLANRFNTTVEAILRANPGIDPNNLQVGQVICIPSTPTPPCPPCDGVYYTVRLGDTLYSIASMFNIPLATLIAANPGVDPNNLQVGQLICIPKGETPVICPGGTIYEIRPNDNLSAILLRFNISVMDLMTANPNVNWDSLMPGQRICIMPHRDMGCPCPTGTRKYTIVNADIPSSGAAVVALAQRFNISVSALMMMNSNLTPADFIVGKMICVPA